MHMLGIYQHIAIMTRGYLKELTYLKSSPCFWRRVAGIVPLKLLFAKLLEHQVKVSNFCSKCLYQIIRKMLTGMLALANLKVNQELFRSICYCLNPYNILKV